MLNSREIKDLHPTLQRAANEFLKRCKTAGLNILIHQTLRDNEYQNYLYEQGRTRAGDIITNAKGGSSKHNYGLAFDFCENVKGKEFNDTAFFKACGKIWREMGGVWGGDWAKPDMPHCEFTNGLTTTQLQNGSKMSDVKMKWESSVTTSNSATIQANQATATNLKLGSKGDPVKELQKLLNQSGAKLVIDGIFGTATDTAVRNFQKEKGLVVDGIAGVKTFEALRKVTAMDQTEKEILYRIVEAEAGGEDEKGKILVANVVMNRVKHGDFPNTIKDVVFQDKPAIQFSPIQDKRYYSVVVSQGTRTAVDKALIGVDYSQGALFFIANKAVNGSWHERALSRMFTHGGHTFFK